MIKSHEKSSKSVEQYLNSLYTLAKIQNALFVLGKPFGIPDLLGQLGYSDSIIDNGFITNELADAGDFDFIEPTLGNSLGVAQGLALKNPDRLVCCFISDAQLFMGPTLEAILSIGAMNLKNIWLCVDYNKMGSRGKLPEFNFEGIFWNWDISYLDVEDFLPFPKIESNPKLWVFNSYKIFEKIK